MFNKNITAMAPSRSMLIMAKAKRMKAEDPEIIDLSGGEPDFATPDRICQEMFKYVSEGYTHYTVGPGLPELRERIAKKLRDENSCNYNANQIIVTPGGKYAIYLAVRTLINEGDEVIYLNPGWVSYPSIVTASGGVPVAINLDYDSGYAITENQLEAAYSEKTKLLIINYPNNPTGKLLTESDMKAIKSFMLRHENVWLLSDEMYERIVFDGKKNISPASYDELISRIITVNGFSKSVAMTGWRIGYVAAPEELIKYSTKLFQNTISCVSGFVQKAAVVALDCTDEIEMMKHSYEKRRDDFISALNKIEGVTAYYPDGAFYAWVCFDAEGMNSEEICDYILNEAKVVGVPGISYGEENKVCMRFSFASDEKDLEQAAINIKSAMAKLKK